MTTGYDRDDPESADAAPVARDPMAEARALLATAGRPRSRQWLGGWRRRTVAAVVILGAIGFLAFQGLTNATQYFQTTAQAVAHRASLGTRPFRIEGTVECGVHNVGVNGSELAFTITGAGQAVRVVSTGSPTQVFRPGVPVVLEGHWQGDIFASDQIMVKHTASYTEAHPGRTAVTSTACGSAS
jgi:cytochrome c-type biogenesis protein CcmE